METKPETNTDVGSAIGLNGQAGPPLPLNESLRPIIRKLRGYAYDPSLSIQLDLASINTATFPIRWEEDLKPGPIGEYLEVIDVDPASRAFYLPVNLNDKHILAQDGLPPSESNPQFHQQMVYTVAMLTIQHFEKALGRKTFWSSEDYKRKTDTQRWEPEKFVQRLRIYPHAIRHANAYYSPDKKAVLFGYFPARPYNETSLMPGSLVFTCLSHDIIAHEVTHALIDGLRKRFRATYNPDTAALHEAFSDLVALFQHFTFPEALEQQIAKTQGELQNEHLLGELAQQFGLAIGNYGSLREAIGEKNEKGEWQPRKPDANLYKNEIKPHKRGSILVAAVFGAFLSIYRKRVADLFRIATNGTGILPQGHIHPDLVKRLAGEASRTAKHFLGIIIRALDYCPPVYMTFGDFLRAIVTADLDLVPNDSLGYRVACIESFKQWGIYPEKVLTLSQENLAYVNYSDKELSELFDNEDVPGGADFVRDIRNRLRRFFDEASNDKERRSIFSIGCRTKQDFHRLIRQATHEQRRVLEEITGLILTIEPDKDNGDKPMMSERRNKDGTGELSMKVYQENRPVLDLSLEIKRKELMNEKGQKLGEPRFYPDFEIHTLNRSQRVGPDNVILNQVIMTITQGMNLVDPNRPTAKDTPEFRSGCTLVIDMDKLDIKVIAKRTGDRSRLATFLNRQGVTDVLPGDSPFLVTQLSRRVAEPFAILHDRR